MNKFSLFLVFAAFALLACSEDKTETNHYELCAKKTITKECLEGKWLLASVEGGNSACKPNDMMYNSLELKKDGQFVFIGGYDGDERELEKSGNWKLSDSTITIECKLGDCVDGIVYPVDATIEIRESGEKLRITTTNGISSFLQCSLKGATFTEVFSRSGN